MRSATPSSASPESLIPPEWQAEYDAKKAKESAARAQREVPALPAIKGKRSHCMALTACAGEVARIKLIDPDNVPA